MGRFVKAVFALFLAAGGLTTVAPMVAAEASGLPSITAGDVAIAEGDSGVSIAKASVDLSTVSAVPVTAHWALTQGSADGTDAKLASGNFNFAPGVTTKAVSIRVYGDSLPEANQSLNLVLSNPVGATLGGNGTITILDDDSNGPAAGIEVNVGIGTVTEANGGTHKVNVPITLSSPASAPFTVYYSFSCSTGAGAGNVTGKRTGSLKFLVGQQSKTVVLTVGPNSIAQGDEALIANIRLSGGPAVTARSVGGIVVRDDETLAVGSTERVSVTSAGDESQYIDFSSFEVPEGLPIPAGWDCAILTPSMTPAMSGDGRFVAFVSRAGDLVGGDTNGLPDVFLHDRVNGTTERISMKSDGSQVTASDGNPNPALGISPVKVESVSGDGRYVAVTSNARMVPQDTGTGADVYVIDAIAHSIELESGALDGSAANDGGAGPVGISGDGRFVTFVSSAGNLVGNDVDPPDVNFSGTIIHYTADVFVRDRQAATTTLVSTTSDPQGAWARSPAISADGQMIAFQGSKNIASGTSIDTELFVADVTTGASQDVGTDGASPSLSADGRYLTFNRYSSNATWQTMLRDRTTGADDVVDADGPNMSAQRSVNPGRSPVSADGRYVAFECWCQRDFAAGYGHLGVFLRDRTAGTTTEVDMSATGNIVDVPWSAVEFGGMSQDGSFVSFASAAPDLVEGDTNAMADAFVRRMHS